jgi:acetyl esterase/lipase
MKMKEIMTTLNAHAKIRSLVDEEKKRPGLLILPGGGFFTLSAKEGMRIAEEFSKRKYNCFVLSYSTVNNNRKYCCWDAAYDDLINAIELLKKNRNKYCIDNHLFLMGFSAGGNLAATYGNDHGDDCDGIVLGYPAVDFEMIFEKT